MIKRHFTPKNMARVGVVIDRFEENTALVINSAKNKNSGEVLGICIPKAINAFAESIVAEKPPATALRYLTFAKELGAANFTFVMRMEETFQTSLLGEQFEMTGAHKVSYVDTDVWLKSFFCAQILRDSAAIDALNEVDETVFFNAELKPDALDLRMVDLMQGIYKGHRDLNTLLTNAWEAEPEDSRVEYVASHFMPLLSVMRTIFTPDAEAEYNKEMREAVELHKKFWSQSEDHEWEPEAWVSLPLIAMAALAYDHKGYELDFETDYIPDWLVKKQF
ncbi:hypothetical protein DU002_11265 [Corallincola holothuriorum]|uniref:Immunity protein 49 n=1 Tax=Corallincola holothuriorum TaxID=2282215 RepID=A0A368NIM4_9GAMM|nr:immunity 49 family protein [Corallincola holothuriorum]RCU49494.1 hypothetical protein DU002_11265 [Corallincola holothuriorum]